ncbi:MAG: glycosyltransferase family 1 protein [bacterium]
MKILYDNIIFINQNYGGVPRYFFELMTYYTQNKSLDFDFPILYSENEYLKDTDIAPWVKRFKKSGLLKIGEIRKNLRKLNQFLVKQAICSKKHDVFHPTFYQDYYIDLIDDKKLVITIHDMIQEIFSEDFKDDPTQGAKYKKMCAYRADAIIAVSENTKTDILKFYPDINPDKIEVIYHGNPFDRFEESNKPLIDMPKRYILYVGNRNLYKNFNFFIESIADLLKQDESLNLFITGSAAISSEEFKLFNYLGINKSIVYHRSTDNELLYLYQNAVCFVFPSLYEGFGFPILEAFGASCPVIAGNISSLPEIGLNACEYFDPRNSKSILETVRKVVYDEELKCSMIEKGLKRANDFSWEKTALKTMSVYEKVITL